MTARAVSTAIDTVLAVSLVTAAVTALVLLTPTPTPVPPDADAALDSLAVTTATVDGTTGAVRATLATHLTTAARVPGTPYAGAVESTVARRLDSLPGRENVTVLRNGTRAFAAGPPVPTTGDVNAASLPLSPVQRGTGSVTVVLWRWWA